MQPAAHPRRGVRTPRTSGARDEAGRPAGSSPTLRSASAGLQSSLGSARNRRSSAAMPQAVPARQAPRPGQTLTSTVSGIAGPTSLRSGTSLAGRRRGFLDARHAPARSLAVLEGLGGLARSPLLGGDAASSSGSASPAAGASLTSTVSGIAGPTSSGSGTSLAGGGAVSSTLGTTSSIVGGALKGLGRH